jgi:hypothetical protein
VSSNSKAIAKLKKQSSRWPWEYGLNGFKSWLLQRLPSRFVLWWFKKILIDSEYLLKRESVKFFRYGNVAYGANRDKKCERMLVIAFGLIDREFDAGYVSLIRNAVRSTLKNSKIRFEYSEKILTSTRRLEIMTLDAGGWYVLSRGLFSLGYFRAALVAREKSLDQSISEAVVRDSSSTSLSRGLQAYLERMNLVELKVILRDRGGQISEKHLSQFKTFLSVFEHGYECALNVEGSRCTQNETIFKQLIKDKSVAIVGPGSPHSNYGAEIEGFETVIRIKYIGNEVVDEKNYHGSRTDISFIGAINAVKIQENLLQGTLANVRLIVSSHTAVDFIGSIPIYVIEDDDVIYRTPTTSGIRTLKEVIKYLPSKVKVFGFDFYSTLTPYSKEMTMFYEKSSWRFGHPNDFVADGVYFKFARARDFSEHDPVSNFCFAQNLYKAGLFDIEPYGKSILELTPYQYVERLEEMLGDW